MTREATHTFAGVGGVSGGPGYPDYLRTLYSVSRSSVTTMKDSVQEITERYGIEAREVAYDNPEDSADWTPTGRHQALVNPATGELWYIPTREYAPVSPMDKYGPLMARLRERDIHEEVCGQFRLFRKGGDVHADILLDSIRTGEDDQIVLGIQTGHDYYGGKSLYARIIAYDAENDRMMRGLSDTRSRRHVGSARTDVAEWWETVLQQAEEAAGTLPRVIAEAQAYTVDFGDLPLTPTQYLTYAFDGTEYLAENSAEGDQTGGAVRYLPTVPNPTSATYTAYELYCAMASALTHDFHGKDDSTAIRRYVGNANRQLFEPARSEDRILEAAKDDLRGQSDLSGEAAVEQIEERQTAIGEAVRAYKDEKATLKRLVNEADAAGGA